MIGLPYGSGESPAKVVKVVQRSWRKLDLSSARVLRYAEHKKSLFSHRRYTGMKGRWRTKLGLRHQVAN